MKEVHKTRHNIDWTCKLNLTCFTAQKRKKGKEPRKKKGMWDQRTLCWKCMVLRDVNEHACSGYKFAM